MIIPDKLRWLEKHESGRRWLADLPTVVSELAEQWDIEIGIPFENANVSYVVPVSGAAGNAVLKVQWPHEESVCEDDAL